VFTLYPPCLDAGVYSDLGIKCVEDARATRCKDLGSLHVQLKSHLLARSTLTRLLGEQEVHFYCAKLLGLFVTTASTTLTNMYVFSFEILG
jgi:hypothetical protein